MEGSKCVDVEERQIRKVCCFYRVVPFLCGCCYHKSSRKPCTLESFSQADFEEVWKCHQERKVHLKQEMHKESLQQKEIENKQKAPLLKRKRRKQQQVEPSEPYLHQYRRDQKENEKEEHLLLVKREKWKQQQIQHRERFLDQKHQYQRNMVQQWMENSKANHGGLGKTRFAKNSLYGVQLRKPIDYQRTQVFTKL